MPPLNPALPDRDRVVDEIIVYLRAKADERAAQEREGEANAKAAAPATNTTGAASATPAPPDAPDALQAGSK
jgi:hypothetical protein